MRFRPIATIALLSVAVVTGACSSVVESGGSRPGYDIETMDDSVMARIMPADAAEPMLEPSAYSEDDTLHLLLFGSSSCPPVPEKVSSLPGGILQVVLVAQEPNVPCTADYGPHGYTLTGEVVEGATIVKVQSPSTEQSNTYTVRPLP